MFRKIWNKKKICTKIVIYLFYKILRNIFAIKIIPPSFLKIRNKIIFYYLL